MRTVLVGVALVLLAGCSCVQQKKMYVKTVFTNASTHPLNWVTLDAGERELTVGILSPGISATLLDVGWSKAPDQAKLTFIDDKTRKNYSIPVSLTNVNQQVRSGKCREVTIRILDYDKAEIACK